MILITVTTLLIVTGIGSYVFVTFHPVFGGKADETQKAEYQKSNQYQNGIFENQIETDMSMDFMEMLKMMPEFLSRPPEREPDFELPVEKIDSISITTAPDSTTQLTWFGHSAFLMTIEGKKVLIDPMFGESPSPISFMGSKRYSKELPIEIEQLPEIDLVLFSHDHYDHLDYPSVTKLKSKVKQWFVPLGLENHLTKWGVEASKIKTFDWWDETEYMGLKLACTPARHFSGRGLGDRFSTLWASWVIQSDSSRIFFSGDSGYGPHFKEIGERYGPFDFAMMECGQYNEKWDNIHMMPEETIQAGLDINTGRLMPIHWGAFTLAMHSWTDPVERALKASKQTKLEIIVPKIGETFNAVKPEIEGQFWWEKPQ
ncbi:MBL fold metallo-hydrolase [Jiulongibacter sediminis]|uniref:MBL fold metallo-hydrolase n=1 Tax=Jiulongibacter sediminis TaxID=1605367 RepID=UPI0026EC1B80|nr:MBL fold metallo-hydrolase [Jiulongibacter sediminis]